MTRLLIAGLMAAVAVPLIAAAQPTAPMPPMAAMHDGMMHDRVMTRAEIKGHVAKMFARVDANHDGIITKAETDAAHQAMAAKGQGDHAMGKMGAGSGMHRDAGPAFDRIDANHDGMISRAEFVRAHATREQKMGEHNDMHGRMADRIFEKSDTNRDGRITPEERTAAHHMHKGR